MVYTREPKQHLSGIFLVTTLTFVSHRVICNLIFFTTEIRRQLLKSLDEIKMVFEPIRDRSMPLQQFVEYV